MNRRRLEQLRIAVVFIEKAAAQEVKVKLSRGEKPFDLKTLAYDIERLYYYEVRKAKEIACNHHTKKEATQSAFHYLPPSIAKH